MSTIRKMAVKGLKRGSSFCVSRTFTEADVNRFAEISRDFNPVHFDERFAAAKKFDGPICHGLLVGSLLSEIGGQIGWLASEMRFRFIRPVYLGDTVTCRFTITSVDGRGRSEAAVVYENQDKKIVLEAELSGILPGAVEKAVMEDMLTSDVSSSESG